jgi:hypothetical protein
VGFIACAMPICLYRVKQLRQPQQGPAINRWPLGGADGAANSFVEHPGRNAAGCIVRELYIHQIPLSASGTKRFQ